MMAGAEEFRAFIRARGFEPPARIEPGRFERFSTNGKGGDDAGYAKLFPDCEGGIVGDFRSGESWTWQAQRARPLSDVERRAFHERINRERREAEAERERIYKAAAERAHEIWKQAEPAPSDHPYLVRKGVKPHSLKLYRGPLALNGMRCDGALIVPLGNATVGLQSLEFISSKGEKRYLPGGRRGGTYHAIGKPGDVLCMAEGYATGASIFEATGYRTLIAGDAGNLLAVAKQQAPGLRLIVCADNDTQTEGNPGIKAAIEAARATGALLAVPELDGRKCDFNDLAQAKGLQAVKAAIDAAQAAQAQSWPEPLPLPEGLPPVAPFDFELLPATLQAWARDICERVQCPPDYVGATIMAALGSVIGRKVGIRPQEKTDWTEFPNQWALIVGRPGVLKSPAMEAALSPLKRLAASAAESYRVASEEYEQAARLAKIRAEASEKAARAKLAKNPAADISSELVADEVEAPTLKRFIANDSTAAALGELLRQNPNGVLVYRDELVSLLKGLDREDNAEARGFYLTGWAGNSAYTFDRIGRGMNLYIPAVCLSLLGSTQPGRIAEYLRAAVQGGAADDGLIQRFGLLVWPDTVAEWRDVDRWPDSEARRQANAVFEALDSLDPAAVGASSDDVDGVPWLRFDAEGLKLFREGGPLGKRSCGQASCIRRSKRI